MTTKKDLVIVALLTSCLTAVLFMVLPTRSANDPNYNPWADINDDGAIDSTDLGILGGAWGAFGEPINKTALLENKTWQFVTNFTLSEQQTVSPLFFIQGEKWRIKWEPLLVQSCSGFAVWNEDGYCVDFVDISTVIMYHHEAKGLHYIPHGIGNYCVEWFPGPAINFTIESYH